MIRGIIIFILLSTGASHAVAQWNAHVSPVMRMKFENPATSFDIDQRFDVQSYLERTFSRSPLRREQEALRMVANPWKKKNNRLYVGLSIDRSSMGRLRLGRMRYGFSISDEFLVSERSSVSIGLAARYSRSTIDLNEAVWGDQYGEAGVDPAMSSVDVVRIDPSGHIGFSAGMVYRIFLNGRSKHDHLVIGLSAHDIEQWSSDVYIDHSPYSSWYGLQASLQVRTSDRLEWRPQLSVEQRESGTTLHLGSFAHLVWEESARYSKKAGRYESFGIGVFTIPARQWDVGLAYEFGPMTYALYYKRVSHVSSAVGPILSSIAMTAALEF